MQENVDEQKNLSLLGYTFVIKWKRIYASGVNRWRRENVIYYILIITSSIVVSSLSIIVCNFLSYLNPEFGSCNPSSLLSSCALKEIELNRFKNLLNETFQHFWLFFFIFTFLQFVNSSRRCSSVKMNDNHRVAKATAAVMLVNRRWEGDGEVIAT